MLYTVHARLTIEVDIPIEAPTLAEAQDIFERGQEWDIYLDPSATIHEWNLLRISDEPSIPQQVALLSGTTQTLPIADKPIGGDGRVDSEKDNGFVDSGVIIMRDLMDGQEAVIGAQ